MKSSAKKPATAKTKTDTVALLIATKKGGFILSSDNKRRKWDIKGPIFLGNIVHHMALDPREGRVMLMAAKTGHLGPTVFRSKDLGKTWKEASKPPAFAKAPEGEKGRVVDHVFWLTPGHASEPGVWYAGTSPQGLFRSEDGGDTWESVTGFNDHPMREKWTGGPGDGTPDGPKMHSINIDPRDPNRIYIGMSSGGVFESADRGADWKPLNAGCAADFLPDPNPNTAMTRIACGCIRSNRTSSISRTIAAFTGWIVARRAGSRAGFASARRCRNRSATSAFRWSCTRAIPTPSGSFRWTGLRFGRALLPEASPPHTLPATAERPGSGWTRDCHRNMHGSPSFDRR